MRVTLYIYAALICLTAGCGGKKTVVRSVTNENFVAVIEASSTIFGMYDGYLIVNDKAGKNYLTKRLIQNRDGAEEVADEFSLLKIHSNSVSFTATGPHYKGQTNFPFW